MTARPDPAPRLPDATEAPLPAAEEARLRAVGEHLRQHVATTPVPDAAAAWQRLRPRLARPDPRRHTAWWWAPPVLAAAAAAWLLLVRPAVVPPTPTALGNIARADFVQVADDATAVVFVDDESGWLIVWASSPTNGAS
jgi:hypothetical protein